MFLIADSGSTKCDWALIDDSHPVIYTSTAGFNPFFHNEKIIAEGIKGNPKLVKISRQVKNIYFYGAGCSSEKMNIIVRKGLKKIFTRATIMVNHDQTASAYATYKGKPCIACIVGTGSNSCYFDGKNIQESVPALGYILGDEASGSYFGKIFLRKFLYAQIPDKIQKQLVRKYQLNKENIFENVYRRPNANVYLASVMKIISAYKNESFVKEMIAEGVKDFLLHHVCCFSNYQRVETNFVGSIAYHFEDIFRNTAKKMGVKIGSITQKPIEGLVNYHLKYGKI